MRTGSYGVLAVSGDDGYPYAVPLNYVYEENRIYFHMASSGHKLEGVGRCQKVSFCVVAADEVLGEKFTTAYASVIAFGKARLVDREEEKLHALRLLVRRYSEAFEKEGEAAIRKYWKDVSVLAVDIEHMTGKAGTETLKGKEEVFS